MAATNAAALTQPISSGLSLRSTGIPQRTKMAVYIPEADYRSVLGRQGMVGFGASCKQPLKTFWNESCPSSRATSAAFLQRADEISASPLRTDIARSVLIPGCGR